MIYNLEHYLDTLEFTVHLESSFWETEHFVQKYAKRVDFRLLSEELVLQELRCHPGNGTDCGRLLHAVTEREAARGT